ncbi:MAG: hypothetical protein RIE56_11070 [Amphiplicatus sp.]
MTTKTIRLRSIAAKTLRGFSSDRSGLTAVHYGLIAALIALVALPGIQLIGNNTSGQLMSMADKVASDSGDNTGDDDGSSDENASGDTSSGDSASDGGDSGGSSDSGADDGDSAASDNGAADDGKKKKKKKKKK